MDKQEVIVELRRVAELLETTSLAGQQFSQHSHISEQTVKRAFGSWKEAIEAAGLKLIPLGKSSGTWKLCRMMLISKRSFA